MQEKSMMAERRLWTKEEIQNFLDKEDPHYQKIQLPFGLATRGRDRKQTSNLIFAQIAGKTVLDVGCCLGYFCLEALAHGALRAVGWDLNADRVRQGRVIAEILGSSAEYHQCNIEEMVPRETFDTVICLNVLHHVRNPLQTLEKLVQLTRETLVLELASLGTPDRRKAGLSRWQGWVLRRLPIILVEGRRAGQNFFFTRSGIRNLLKIQRQDFARADLLESEFKDRFIIIAQRRRIKHLVVIAGPTSSGKSTLIGEVTGRRLPIMAAKLGIENLPAWPHVGAHSIRELSTPALEGLIFHYDFCLNDGSAGIYEQTRDLDVFKSAETISFVTLWTPPARLERQLYEAELRRSRPRKRHRNLLNIYGQSAQVVSLYRRWFEFCDRLGAKTRNHLIVEFDDALRFYSRAEWEGMVRAYETM